jgi:hypothetical protein
MHMFFRRFLLDRNPLERGSDITPCVRVQTSGGMAFCTRLPPRLTRPRFGAHGFVKKKKPRLLPVFAPWILSKILDFYPFFRRPGHRHLGGLSEGRAGSCCPYRRGLGGSQAHATAQRSMSKRLGMRRESTVMSELGFEFHYTDMYSIYTCCRWRRRLGGSHAHATLIFRPSVQVTRHGRIFRGR